MVLFLFFFLLLFQPFASVVHADETLIPEATPTSTLTPTPSVANPPLAETPTETPIPSPEPTAEPTPELTPEVTPQPVLEITPEATPASIVTPTPKPFWVEVDGDTITTIDNVGEGVDYNFRGASVRFTKVTKPGKLTVKQVKLTSEQIAATGALSDIAYDITSDMENGSFFYDLTLPLPQNTPEADVKFAESTEKLAESQSISQPEEKTENTITIRGLDHLTIFFVTSGIDQATNGSFCDDLINCNIDANLPSLEIVDSDYLEISSFVDEIPALWGNGDFSDDRYVQFNFSPGLDDDTSIYNSRLDIVYKTNEIDESSDFGAKLVVSADDDFDEETDFVSLLTPDVSKPDEDQPFTIDLPGKYLEAATLNNLKARFYFFGDPLAEEAPGVITSFNQVILDILSDETPPSDGSLIINDDDPYTKNRDVSLTISALDSLSDVAEMSLANLNSYHDWEPYLTTQSWTLPDTDGLKTVRAKFKDSAGNENESYLASDTIILDRVAPSSSATSPEYDNDGIIPVSLTADDANGEATVSGVFQTSLWYRFNEGEWIDSEMTLPDTLGTFDFFPEDGDGAYEFYTIATDNAGNQESENYEEGDESVIPDSSTVFDTTAPVVTVTAFPTVNNTNKTSVALSGVCETSLAMTLAVGSVTASPAPICTGSAWTKTLDLSSLAEGILTATASQNDSAGNLGTGSKTATKDVTAPTVFAAVSAGTIGSNGWYTSNVTVHFICSDAGSGIASCPADQILSTEGSSISSTAQTATDNAGNTSASSNIVTVKIDKTQPVSAFDSTPSSISNSNSATFNFHATDTNGIASSDCKIDADLYSTCTSPKSYSGLSDGSHTVSVRSTDTAGNIESTATFTWTVDTSAPVIIVPADITAEATSSLGAIVTYTPPTATDTQDGSVAVSCDKNSGDTFSLGLTTVNCSSTDSAGNTASKTFKVTVSDTTIPVITLDGTISITLEIHSSYSDAGATASDNIDGDLTPSVATVNPVNKDVLGSYVVTYDVSDSSGNPAAQITRTVNVVDTTAPTTPSATPAAGDYATDQLATLSSSDGGSGLASIYYTIDGATPDNNKTLYSTTITVNKDMTIKAVAYDNAGNISTILTAVYGIAPEISAETSSSVTSTSTTITWTTDDPATSRVVYDTVSHAVLGEGSNYGYANSTIEADTEPKVISHSVTIFGLTAGTTYYYRTVSRGSPEAVSDEHTLATPSSSGEGGNGGSGVSDGRSDGLGGQTPVCNNAKPGSAPTLFSALGGINNVTLKWTEAADPLTYYLITYGARPGAQTYGNPNVGGKGTTGYTVSGLSGGITYYFQVRAGNGCAPGDFSNEVGATTLGAAIAGETPAEGFSPEVKGVSTDVTPTETVTPSPEVLGESESKNNLTPWLILIFITSGGLVSWAFWRAR